MRNTALFAAASFALAVSAPAGAQIAQVSTGHNDEYQQTGQGSVTEVGGFFSADIVKNGDGVSPPGVLNYPGGTALLIQSASDPTDLHFQTDYIGNRAALDTAFPLGGYTFVLGNQSVTTTIPSTLYAAQAPQVANFNALSTLDPTQSFVLSLTGGFTPQGDESFTFLTITDETANSLVYSQGFLSPSTVNFAIAANTFTAGHSYEFEADFDNRFSTTASDGVTPAFNLFDVRTYGDFAIAAAVPEPSSWALMIGGLGLVGGVMRRRRAIPPHGRPVVA